MRKRRTKTTPTTPQNYPSGCCVRTEAGIFYIRGGKRFRIVSGRVEQSWAFPRVIQTSEAAVAKYRIAGRLGFREGSLIYNIKDGHTYLIADNKRRHVTSPDVLSRLGAKPQDVIIVSDAEINLHETGDTID